MSGRLGWRLRPWASWQRAGASLGRWLLAAGAAVLLQAHALAQAPAGSTPASAPCVVRTPALQGNYVGDCHAGYASGVGRATGTDRYEGGFRDGYPSGNGVYTFADGRRFEGEFLEGKVNGRAKYFFKSGDVLEGLFRDNALLGQGRMRRPSGEVQIVEIRGGGLFVVSVESPAPAVAAAPPIATPPSSPVAGGGGQVSPGGLAATAASSWVPLLELGDLFPAFIIATSTAKPLTVAGSRGSASMEVRGGHPLAALSPAQVLATGAAGVAPGAQARLSIGREGAQYLGDTWGSVGIRFANGQAGTQVTVAIAVDEVAEASEETFALSTKGDYVLFPRVRYRYDKLRAVEQPFPVNVTFVVTVNGQPAGRTTVVTRVRSIQDAPTVLFKERGFESMHWIYGAFVTEDAAWLDELVRLAFAGNSAVALGYQAGPQAVDEQVAALFDMLGKRGLKYSSITTSSGSKERVFSQIVRFPRDSIRTSQANCVDGTVLMASLLRKIGIEPLIVTGPGHALLGYYRRLPKGETKGELAFVETTDIGERPFEEARRSAMQTVQKWDANERNNPLFNLIPVRVVRAEGVMPIPR